MKLNDLKIDKNKKVDNEKLIERLKKEISEYKKSDFGIKRDLTEKE